MGFVLEGYLSCYSPTSCFSSSHNFQLLSVFQSITTHYLYSSHSFFLKQTKCSHSALSRLLPPLHSLHSPPLPHSIPPAILAVPPVSSAQWPTSLKLAVWAPGTSVSVTTLTGAMTRLRASMTRSVRVANSFAQTLPLTVLSQWLLLRSRLTKSRLRVSLQTLLSSSTRSLKFFLALLASAKTNGAKPVVLPLLLTSLPSPSARSSR